MDRLRAIAGTTWILTLLSLTEAGTFYGNEIKERSAYIRGFGRKAFVDSDVFLVPGSLEVFHVYIHRLYGSAVPNLTLQIWSPVQNPMQPEYYLRWQKHIMFNNGDNTTYQFTIESDEGVVIGSNDRIGFTTTAPLNPVSLDYTDNRYVYFRTFPENDQPIVGRSYPFDSHYLPAVFSIGVTIKPSQVERVPPFIWVMGPTDEDKMRLAKTSGEENVVVKHHVSCSASPVSATTIWMYCTWISVLGLWMWS